MAIKEIYEFDENAPANNFAPIDGGWVEEMDRSDVNDAARANLQSHRRFYNDREWTVVRIQGPLNGDIGSFNRVNNTRFTIDLTGVDLTGYFSDGRILKIVDAGATGSGSDLITQVEGAAAYNGTNLTTVDIRATDVMHGDATDSVVHAMENLRSLAFLDDSTQFFIPDTADSAGIQGAITAAGAAGGGVVYLIAPSYAIDATIDLTGVAGVTILGSGSRTTLLQDAGADLDQMIDLGNVSYNILRDLTINVNDGLNSGLNYGVLVSDTNCEITECVIQACSVGIKIASGSYANLIISKCHIVDWTQAAIEGTSVSDGHAGYISDCFIDGASATGTDPAGIKLAGSWAIYANRLTSIQDSLLSIRGIWLWNKTAGDNGGSFSRVYGNYIAGSLATNPAVGIEVGGSYSDVYGNVVQLFGTSSLGIDVRGNQAGQYVEHSNVNDNAIRAESGIRFNSLVRRCTARGNTITALATGVESDAVFGTDISDNVIGGGVDGVDILTNSALTSVSNNRITGQSGTGVILAGSSSGSLVHGNSIGGAPATGISVGASVTTSSLKDNSFSSGVSNDIVDAAADTLKWDNGDCRQQETGEPSAHAVTTSSSISSVSGQDMPGYGGPGDYECHVYAAATGDTLDTELRVGPNGDIADPIVASERITISTTERAHLLFTLTSGLDVKFGISGTAVNTSGTLTFARWSIKKVTGR